MKIESGRVTVRAPAKLNLTLSVLGRLESGYHLLSSLVYPLTLRDEVSVSISTEKIITVCFDANLASHLQSSLGETEFQDLKRELNSEKNLAYRAAEAFFAARGVPSGFEIKITKSIPLGAGLGGGSSDAAAVLRGLNELTGSPFSESELISLGASIGADVPALLCPKLCFMTGVGDILCPLSIAAYEKLALMIKPMKLLLLKPAVSVSTPKAYESLGFAKEISAEKANDFILQRLKNDELLKGLGLQFESKQGGDKWLTLLPQEGIRLTLDSGSSEQIAKYFVNDFHELMAKEFSEIASACSLLKQAGAFHVLLCGSGSTVAGFFVDEAKFATAFQFLKQQSPSGWFTVEADFVIS